MLDFVHPGSMNSLKMTTMLWILALTMNFLAFASATSGVLKFPLQRKASSHARTTVNATVNGGLQFNDRWIDGGGYLVSITIGTPPQAFEVCETVPGGCGAKRRSSHLAACSLTVTKGPAGHRE